MCPYKILEVLPVFSALASLLQVSHTFHPGDGRGGHGPHSDAPAVNKISSSHARQCVHNDSNNDSDAATVLGEMSLILVLYRKCVTHHRHFLHRRYYSLAQIYMAEHQLL